MTTVNNKVIVLFGRTGNGKSSTGNTLLGMDTFLVVKGSANSVTKIISQSSFKYQNDNWTVYDMPGLYETEQTISEYESVKCGIDMFKKFLDQISSIGVHVFIFVCNADDRFSDEQRKCLSYYKAVLGEDFLQKYGIVVFTRGDSISCDGSNMTEKFNSWIKIQESKDKNSVTYRTVYDECQQRGCLVSNVSSPVDREQSRVWLINEIQNLINKSQTSYSWDTYQKYETSRAQFLQKIKNNTSYCVIL